MTPLIITLEPIELRQIRPNLVRVTFPDGRSCDVIAKLTRELGEQRRIVDIAKQGVGG